MSTPKIVSIVASIIFMIIWSLAMWKGQVFLSWPLYVKLPIAFSICGGMFAWITYLHRVMDKNNGNP